MLHLFNKVYLAFDDSIDCHTNRYVISAETGNEMHQELQTTYRGTLINYSHNVNEMAGKYDDLTGFFEDVKSKQGTLGTKVIIYCDSEAYLNLSVTWLKTMLPFADQTAVQKFLDIHLHHEKIIANTQLQPTHTLALTKINAVLGDVAGYFNVLPTLDLDRIKALNLNFSIELLLGEYFAGADTHQANLLSTWHLFLKRFYKEVLTDSREGAALNLLNTNQQTALGYTSDDVDLNNDNPFSGITPLAPFADEDVFTQKPTANVGAVNIANIDGLSTDKQTALKTLIKDLYDFQNSPDPDYFMNHLDKACASSLSSNDFDTIITETVNSPSSLSFIPRFDIGNINYTFLQYLFSLKKSNDTDTLGKYRLFANS